VGNTPRSAIVPMAAPADSPEGETPYAPLPWTPSPLGCTGLPTSRPLPRDSMGGMMGRITLWRL